MQALRSLFDEDAAFVNRFGRYVRGADAIVGLHAPIYETVYGDSSLQNELIDEIHIGASATVVHFGSRLTVGSAQPAGPHCVDTLIQAVMIRNQGCWVIRAFENVTLTNPRTGEAMLRDNE